MPTGDGNADGWPIEGVLLDDHVLTARARSYAVAVVHGDEFPMGPEHVDLSEVEWRTSARMERRHGHAGRGDPTVNASTAQERPYYVHLSEKSYEDAGWDFLRETVRHELVHVHQYQRRGSADHGPSFRRWIEPMEIDGTRSTYDRDPIDHYRYPFHCDRCDEIVGGRHRYCATVASVAGDGGASCGRERGGERCGGTLRLVRSDGRVLRRQSSDYRDAVAAFVDGEARQTTARADVRK